MKIDNNSFGLSISLIIITNFLLILNYDKNPKKSYLLA